MLIKCLPVGNMEENCYVVTDEKTLMCAVIDPGDESNVIMDYIEEHGLKPQVILLTHGHFDHTGAADAVAEETGVKILLHQKDAADPARRELYRYAPPANSGFIKEGDVITVGSIKFKVMETPGHTPGSVTFIADGALFTGDTLFHGSCGRADLPGGDMDAEMASLKRLADLPGDFEVWPGHMDPTTLDAERGSNYYMRYATGK